jgi:hypothetical protein
MTDDIESNNVTVTWVVPCQPTLAPPSQTHTTGNTATVTATLTGGPMCDQPLQGARVKFTGTGPNGPL